MAALLADLASIFAYLLDFVLFLLPGFAVTMTIAERREISRVQAVIAIVSASATAGYVAFWIFFANRPLGKVFSYTCFAISITAAWILLKRNPRCKALARSIVVPFAYAAVSGVFYLCWFYLLHNPLRSGPDLANSTFFAEVRPGDNVIPYIFAQKIYSHEPLKPFCCGDWLSSDRPPLQTGIYLLERPLRLVSPGVNDQLTGTALQSLWICGSWILLTAVSATERQIKQILGLLIFSGFLFYNTVYVWPKLFAATFVLFCAAILLDARAKNRSFTPFEVTLAAISFTLASLAHPGSVFSAPALILLLFPIRKSIRLRQLAYASLLIVLFQLPWTAYQRFYDPPGNRLLKMHLAGDMGPDNLSAWQALKNGYTRAPVATLFFNKSQNLRTLLGSNVFHSGLDWQSLRIAERETISYAVGVLNAGWIAVLVYCFRWIKAPRVRFDLLLLISLIDLIVWSIVIYGPGYTVTAHSSYADILLLSMGLCGFLIALPRLAMCVFALQIANLFAVWVWSLPKQTIPAGAPLLEWPFLVIGICCALGLIWHFGRAYRADVDSISSK